MHFLCLTLVVNFGTAFAATLGTTSGSDFTTASWTNSSSTSYGTFYHLANPGSSFAIADSSQGGRTSIGPQAFNLTPGSYTNTGLGYARTFYVFSGGALTVGQTLSFEINFLFSNGTKGFTLEKSGGGANSDLFTVRQDWGDSIQTLGGGLSGTNTIADFSGYQKALKLEATQQNGSIDLNIKDGVTSIFTQTFLTAETIGQIHFFAGNIHPSQEGDRDSQGIFFNNISVVPEPSALSLLTLGSLGLLVLRRRLKS